MGFDAAGVVVATGPGVTKISVGDEVYGCVGAMPGLGGAFSQRMLADERLLAKKPASLSFRETAALSLAVGGVRHFGVQIAKAMGAVIHTTISSPE